jgi:hypothetical protein
MSVALCIVTFLCAALALTGCAGRSATYRYKLTLSLNTPGGVKTGSSVVQIHSAHIYFITGDGKGEEARGEALYIDLGPGRPPLIALLTHIRRFDEVAKDGHPYHYRWWEASPTGVLADVCLGGAGSLDVIELALQFNEHCRRPLPITPADLPDLVTFTDANDPKSVLLIDANNLSATLGLGVSWRSITLEATDEPLTKEIDVHLPWVRGYDANIELHGVRSFNSLKDYINVNDFIRDK